MGWFDDIIDGATDIVDHTWDFISGEGAEEAADAAAQQQEAAAEATRAQAKTVRDEGVTALENYVRQSNQAYSSVINRVAAAGGIGFKQTETVTEGGTGIDVGEEDTQAVKDLRAELTGVLGEYESIEQVTAKQEEYQKVVSDLEAELKGKVPFQEPGGDEGNPVQQGNISGEEYADLKAELKKAQEDLAGVTSTATKAKGIQKAIDTTLGVGTEDDLTKVADVTGAQSYGAQFATGSTLRNLSSLRDEFQQARNTYARGVQSDVFSLLTQAENFDISAAATRRAGEIARWDTILGRGMQIVGLGLAL